MRTIRVNLKKRSYSIVIGANTINLLGKYIARLKIGSDAYIITNSRVKNAYGAILTRALRASGITVKFRTVPDSEESKSVDTAFSVLDDLARQDIKKRVFIVAFGGGVIGDLSGFVASIYKRGTPYVQVPTTLLAQVDSSIGGKTAVDLTQGKNLVGAFYQPRLVLSDIAFLETLGPRQIRSGISEVIKYGIIKDARLFSFLENNVKAVMSLKRSAIEFVVYRSSVIKSKIVSEDEREEKQIRTILNFGHTIGHALEAAGRFKKYNHGEAVALGMLVACDISRNLGMLDIKVMQRIELLLEAFGLPTKIGRIPIGKIINAHYHDKKFIGSRNKFVLIEGIGKTKIIENVPLEIIKDSLERRF
jgi:3-dehydroquinate synthase